jgi:hypothetical protein
VAALIGARVGIRGEEFFLTEEKSTRTEGFSLTHFGDKQI